MFFIGIKVDFEILDNNDDDDDSSQGEKIFIGFYIC